MDTKDYEEGLNYERRNHLRIIYKPSQPCTLKIDGKDYNVIDICEAGLKFVNGYKEKLKNRIKGELFLLDGDSVLIDGRIVWQRDGFVGVSLNHYIPAETIEKEQKHHILNIDLSRE